MIQCNQVSKRFDKVAALAGLTCTIPEGCVYGLVGPNGAGKSTLLRLISGIYRPESGSITVDGLPADSVAAKSLMAFVPDELFFLPGKITAMIDLYAASYPNFSRERCLSLLREFDLPQKRSVNGFSKGMKRQAAIALALACQSKYLMMDETFDGLDPIKRARVRALLAEQAAGGATVIIASHSLRELEDTAQKLALLHEGKLVVQQEMENLQISLCKVQISLREAFDRTAFADMEVLSYNQQGSVANIIVRGEAGQVLATLRALDPVVLEAVPLSLEEVFTYEMEALSGGAPPPSRGDAG